jgi:methylmalonyl-CoA mutase N-terminal domain/subunit
LDEISELGGVIPAIEMGYFQKRIADSSYRYEQALAEQRKIVVGVNALRSDESPDIPILQMDPTGEGRQRERLASLRQSRDAQHWTEALSALETAAREERNLMPALIDAVKAYATLGEITNRLRVVYGAHRPLLVV